MQHEDDYNDDDLRQLLMGHSVWRGTRQVIIRNVCIDVKRWRRTATAEVLKLQSTPRKQAKAEGDLVWYSDLLASQKYHPEEMGASRKWYCPVVSKPYLRDRLREIIFLCGGPSARK